MEHLQCILEHYPQYRIMLCKQCRNGIVRSQLSSHLRNHHRGLTHPVKQSVLLAASTIGDWADKDDAVIFPIAIIPPVPHLSIIPDGLKCMVSNAAGVSCNFLCRGVQHMQNYCRDRHGWINPVKKGRVQKRSNINHPALWVEGVRCQKFSTHGLLARLFEIHRPGLDAQQQEDFISQDFQDKRRLLISSVAKAKQDREETARHAIVEPDTNRFIPTAWLTRAGWARHLAGLDRDWLASLMSPPALHEKALAKVCFGVEKVVWLAQQASNPHKVGLAALNYINRRETGNDTNEKPFNASQVGSTVIKYCDHWVRIIRYVWRTHHLAPMIRHSQSHDDQEHDDDESVHYRPPYALTAQQIQALHRIQHLIGEDDEPDSDQASESDEEVPEISDEELRELEELTLSLMLV